MKAINQHKIAQHQETLMRARILKLKKEEERANKRIRDAFRRNQLVSEMNAFKQQKIHMKDSNVNYMKFVENNNRQKFYEYRT